MKKLIAEFYEIWKTSVMSVVYLAGFLGYVLGVIWFMTNIPMPRGAFGMFLTLLLTLTLCVPVVYVVIKVYLSLMDLEVEFRAEAHRRGRVYAEKDLRRLRGK